MKRPSRVAAAVFAGGLLFVAPPVTRVAGSLDLFTVDPATGETPRLTSTSGATPPSNVVPPRIAGTARIGGKLEASTGEWTGDPPIAYRYQWQACNDDAVCATLHGATSATIVLTMARLGAQMRVVVTATNSAGSAAAVSPPTPVVNGGKATPWPVRVVPTVMGKTVAAARAAIARAHCITGDITKAYSRTVAAGHVISQRPRAGTRRAGGIIVDLVVSRGKRSTR